MHGINGAVRGMGGTVHGITQYFMGYFNQALNLSSGFFKKSYGIFKIIYFDIFSQ